MVPACSYQALHTTLTSQNRELPPLEGRVINVEKASCGKRALRVIQIAAPYIAYFVIAAAAIAALVLTHQALLPILCVAGVLALPIIAPLTCRAISYLSTKDIRQQVVNAQVKHLKEAFECSLKDRTFVRAQKGSDDELTAEGLTQDDICRELLAEGISDISAREFSRKVIQLRNEVLALTREGTDVGLNSVQEMYGKFQGLAEDPLFRQVYKNIRGKNLACVNFLQILAMKFRTASVGEVMGKYAGKNMPKARDGKYTPEELGNVLHQHQKRWGFKRNNPLQAIFWAFGYPDSFAGSVTSNQTPQLYDNMKANNAASFMDFDCNAVPVSIVAQPTLAADPVFELIGADAADQIVVNQLDICKTHEQGWIQDLQASTKGTRTDHMLFGFATKKKSSLMEAKTVSQLLNNYKTQIISKGRSIDSCTPVGTYVSRDSLTDTEIDGCFKQVEALLSSDIQLDKKKKQAVLALADAMLIFKRIVKKTEGMKKSPVGDRNMQGLTVSIGCKQCQDRGPVLVETVMLLLKAYELDGKRGLTKEEFYQIASIALRAEINDGRLQLKEKAEVLEELLKLMGGNIGRVSGHTRALAPVKGQERGSVSSDSTLAVGLAADHAFAQTM